MPTLELPMLAIRSVTAVTESARVLLINRSPEPDEQGVPVDTTITLEITDLGAAGISAFGTFVVVNWMSAFEGPTTPQFQPGFDGPKSSVVATDTSLRIVVDLRVPLQSLSNGMVWVSSHTNDGEYFEEQYWFTVEDRTAPRVVAAQATGQKAVRVAFDEPIAVPEGATFVIAARGAPAVPVNAVGVDVDSAVATLSLDIEMSPDIEYEVVAVGVTDLSGNAVMGPYDRARFVGFRAARPPTRRFDLWQMLPQHNRRDDETGDLRRFVSCLQDVTDLLLAGLDRFTDIFDIDRAPEGFLDCILLDLGNPFYFDLDLLSRRKLASLLVEMYRQKGTAKGIENAVRFFLGIEVTAISQLNASTLSLGDSELGVDWVLGPSDRFARYAFNVEVSRVLTALERSQLRTIVNYLRPGHTHFVDLLEPTTPITDDLWELGMSELGITTTLN